MIKNPTIALKQTILKHCNSLTTLPNLKNEADYLANHLLQKNNIVVLDGYHFDTAYQNTLKKAGLKVVCIDDIHPHPFVADAVVNHAPGVSASNYQVTKGAKLCLGLAYSLLRPAFLKAAKQQRSFSTIESIFICFGGADPNNLTAKAIKNIAVNVLHLKNIIAILGTAHPSHSNIEKFSKDITNVKIQTYSNQSAEQMLALMQQSQLAIVPASSVLFEVIAVKMPVLSGYFVDNQVNIYQGFKDLNLIHGIGDFNTFEDYSSVISEIRKSDFSKIMQRQAAALTGDSKHNYLNLFKYL